VSDCADIDWFGAGWAVFEGARSSEGFPPLNDMEAQRKWLAGFGAAWVECPDQALLETMLDGDWLGGASVDEALARALDGHGDLLRQLRAHAQGQANQTVN
jgi:hypothetical protein